MVHLEISKGLTKPHSQPNILFGNAMAMNKTRGSVRSLTNDALLFGSGAESTRDKRVQRTLNDLRQALLSLIAERGYEPLTVQDILDRAGVGRATFYLHYRGKDDLLRRSLEPLRQHLLEEWKRAANRSGGVGARLGFVLPFLQHVDIHRALYRATVGHESWTIVHREIKRMLTDFAAQAMGSTHRKDLAAGLIPEYVAGALLSVVVWWLESGIKATAEEMNEVFVRMAGGTLQAMQKPGAAGEPAPRL
jgi:AcrR family transcriptional regulator